MTATQNMCKLIVVVLTDLNVNRTAKLTVNYACVVAILLQYLYMFTTIDQ